MAWNGIWVVFWLHLVDVWAQELRCRSDLSREECYEKVLSIDEYTFFVNGTEIITYKKNKYFHLTCSKNVPVDSAILPKFDIGIALEEVVLQDCSPPTGGYADALRELNIIPNFRLELKYISTQVVMRADHLRDLHIKRLVLDAFKETVRLDPDAFEPFLELRDLRLTRVELSNAAMMKLPQTLEHLLLAQCNLSTLSVDFARLINLNSLIIRDRGLREVDLGNTPILNEIKIEAPLEELTLGAGTKILTMYSTHSVKLQGNCSGLLNVSLWRAKQALPRAWLSGCSNVRKLTVGESPGVIGADELEGARALRHLHVERCDLQDLSPNWLKDTVALQTLDLSRNKLKVLPSELFSVTKNLEKVVMAYNQLRFDDVVMIAKLPALRTLVLDYNPLSNLCGDSNEYGTYKMSPLWMAGNLNELWLKHTGLQHVCPDWYSNLHMLTKLDLRSNNISTLDYFELKWKRDVRSTVDLRDNPVNIVYNAAKYKEALSEPTRDDTTSVTAILIDNVVKCDCYEYWFVRAMRERPRHVPVVFDELICEDGTGRHRLLDMPLDELYCDMPQEKCPDGCSCRATGVASELHCKSAALISAPRAPALPPPRALFLAHNNISTVHLEDINPELEILDLSYNNISQINASITAVIFNGERSVLLAGNPLDCSCAALPLMHAVSTHHNRVLDLPQARCADGRRLADASTRASVACITLPWWPLVLGAITLVAVSGSAVAYIRRPVVRQRVKRFLFERGLCLKWILQPMRSEGDDERPYDAFVSFSQLDRSYADKVAMHLESGPCARRLCLHDRDWVPGDWIPTQITRSVRLSRRTIVLLSENFLASTWARAELREAYAAALRDERPRLLLVLLPGFTHERAAAADEDLQVYLSRVTYLCWEELAFWNKLSLAIPPRSTPVAPREMSHSTPTPMACPA